VQNRDAAIADDAAMVSARQLARLPGVDVMLASSLVNFFATLMCSDEPL
jgi:hypothetical protein